MFIEGDVIFSYGRHFPIAKRLGVSEYVFNIDSYSSSTARHQGDVRSAMQYKTRWDAPCCDFHRIPGWLSKEVQALHARILKGRSRVSDYVKQLDNYRFYWESCKDRFNLKNEKLDNLFLFKDKDEIRVKLVTLRFLEAV